VSKRARESLDGFLAIGVRVRYPARTSTAENPMTTTTATTFRFEAGQTSRPAARLASIADGRLLGRDRALAGRHMR
jgi:hypothetical protein